MIDIPHKKKVTNEFKLWQIVFLHFIAIKRKLLKFFESISHVTFFKTKFFFLRIQVRDKERCIETYDIYQINVSELYELCSNKRSEILLVVRNVCLWNTERSILKMILLKLSLELSNDTKTRCHFQIKG